MQFFFLHFWVLICNFIASHITCHVLYSYITDRINIDYLS